MRSILRIILILILLIPLISSAQQQRRFVAEWEPAWGTLIRWPLGIPSDLVIELAVDDSLYVLVESYYERDQALESFGNWGVNTDHCRFIFTPSYSHWTRDWGPHYVFNEEGVCGIADPIFDGYPWVPGCNDKYEEYGVTYPSGRKLGWEEDDAVNIALADSFNCPLINLPVYLTGGNIMVDGHNTAISTLQMLDENFPIANEEYFREIAEDSLGISNYIIVDNPEMYGIQHIDCYAKYLNEETILVKQVDEWNPEYQCCEDLSELLGNELNCWGEPYNIIRIYCGAYNGVEVAAYTNSLILNTKVLVPLFGISSDETALQAYEQAMPGYEVIGYDWEDWFYYDALHCRTMGIFDRHMLRIVHKPLKGDVQFLGTPQIIVQIDDRSEAGLIEDELLLYYREQGSTNWNFTNLLPTSGTDSFVAIIPGLVVGMHIEYYISAADYSGRTETLPRSAPDGFDSFTCNGITTQIKKVNSEEIINVYPSPFSDICIIKISSPEYQKISLDIVNRTGVKIKSLVSNEQLVNPTSVIWSGVDENGNQVADGIYFTLLNISGRTVTQKIVKKKPGN